MLVLLASGVVVGTAVWFWLTGFNVAALKFLSTVPATGGH
jgi:hypothetical protein